MLGEDHSLVNEFPELKMIIAQLVESDETFARDNERYSELDKEIRELELKDAPIGDDAMHALKHDRRVLKDALYARLVAAEKNAD